MRDALVKMRDGRVFCGPLWAFNVPSGYLTIPSETTDLLYFRDILSATKDGEDLLERARRWGWDGT